MLRFLRVYLLGCIAISFTFLVLHAREPLRLNVGDPWSDAAAVSSIAYVKEHGFTTPLMSEAYRPIHDSPLREVIYR